MFVMYIQRCLLALLNTLIVLLILLFMQECPRFARPEGRVFDRKWSQNGGAFDHVIGPHRGVCPGGGLGWALSELTSALRTPTQSSLILLQVFSFVDFLVQGIDRINGHYSCITFICFCNLFTIIS